MHQVEVGSDATTTRENGGRAGNGLPLTTNEGDGQISKKHLLL